MDYREMYFQLFRRQIHVIETLENLVDELKFGHKVTEEMVMDATNADESEEARSE